MLKSTNNDVEKMSTATICGSQGMSLFNEIVTGMEAHKQLFGRKHKIQFAALKRQAVRHDLLEDWQPLIDKAFAIQSDALGVQI